MPAPPYAPPPNYGRYPPPPGHRRHVSLVAAAGLSLAGLLGGGAAGAAIMFGATETDSSTATTAAPAALSAEAAQEHTCGVLKANYQSVANAIDAANRLDKRPWTDPELLSAVDTLVAATDRLASELENSPITSAPNEFRAAITNYVAGLRALSLTERNHAPDLQINGVGLFYNQVLDTPLRICGIRS